jgi:hypothetical protein
MEHGWRTVLAPFPARKPSSTAWQNRLTYSSLPDPIAAGSAPPLPPLEARPHEADCIKVERIEKAELPSPYAAMRIYRPTAWRESDSSAVPVHAEPGLESIGSRMLPKAAALPAGRLKTGSGPVLRWDPRSPIFEAHPVMKFLPVRSSEILPPAAKWQPLDAVPL